MKIITKIFFFFTFFIVSSTLTYENSSAQWIPQSTGTLQVLRDIEFINQYTGWACGESGVILKTTDGGKNWNLQPTPVSNKPLFGIHPVDENIVYCVGYFRTILKTTNGGNNWIALQNGIGTGMNSYMGVYFLNKDTGFISGAASYIYKTTDGGITFDSVFHLESAWHRDFYFKNNMEGLLVGDGSIVNKTTDGGGTWSDIWIKSTLPNFRRISCFNDTCFVVGSNGKAFRSIDFGDSWDSIGYVTGADEIYCSKFTSTKIGYAGGTYGRLFKTTDGGQTWKRENTHNEPGFFLSIYGYNDSIVWVCGGSVDGRILYTETGGETLVSIFNNNQNISDNFVLYQNYPNPFNPVTTIEYELINNANVELKIFDMTGKEIKTLVSGNQGYGTYRVSFDASDLAGGVYFYSLKVNSDIIGTKKLVVIK